jgi:asparagine synthase (glutamine-hydrolysing)
MVKWGYDPTLRTPWKEIKQIPPGCFYHGGRIQEYWDWSKIIPTNLADDLRESVVARLGGQRELSVLLSGGLDSSIIYKLISQVTSKSITAVHVDNGEADFANLICDELVHVSLDDVGDEEAIQIHQTPVDLGSVKPQIAMARKLKELGFNAVITGDGADEIFGGYQRAKEYDSQFSDVFCELPYYHLPRLDRIMMASTIECRSPFLSPKVVAYGLSSPYSMRDGEKKLLKEAFRDILPAEILNRDKKPLKTDSIRKDPLAQRKINLEIWKNLG